MTLSLAANHSHSTLTHFLSPTLVTASKPPPRMAWKTGGLFDEEGLPAEMQDTDIRQVLGQQQPHDMGSVLSLIGWTNPHAAGASTVDWTQVTSDNKASSSSGEMLQSGVIRKLRPLLNVTLTGMPAVVKSTAPTSHFNLDLSADMLQRLIAVSRHVGLM